MYVFNFRGIGKLLQLLKYEMKYSIIFKYDFFKCVFFLSIESFQTSFVAKCEHWPDYKINVRVKPV